MANKRIVWNTRNDDAPSPSAGGRLKVTDADQKNLHSKSLVPSVEGAENAKDELIHLLKLAAEIEHTLLVQYLYAAYSVPSGDLVTKILRIAVQEMGHLLGVQNLLLSVGGIENLHLDKTVIRTAEEFKLLPYTLEQVSPNLLAKYVAVESPPDPSQILGSFPKLPEIRKIAFENAGTTFNPVGGLYEKIFWLFQPDDSPVPGMIQLKPDPDCFPAGDHILDTDFVPVNELNKFEPDLTAWSMSSALTNNEVIFSQVFIRDNALKLVNDISAQGERAELGDPDKSHFELFYDAYTGFQSSPVTVLNVPLNPVTKPNDEFIKPTPVTNAYSLLWCDLFNKLYTSALLDIHASIFYKQFDESLPGKFVGVLHFLMSRVLNDITTNVLFKLSLIDNGFTFDQEPRCGPTFEIDDSFQLFTVKDDVHKMNTDIITAIRAKMAEIQAHPDFASHRIKDPNVGLMLKVIDLKYCTPKIALI